MPVCPCPTCQHPGEGGAPERQHHQRLLLVFARLDEAQQRWFAALEADRIGSGGDRLLSQITGLDAKTIQRGRQELAAGLADQPPDRVRQPGGGRLPVEKKTRPSWPI
jgi:hypothetical protein